MASGDSHLHSNNTQHPAQSPMLPQQPPSLSDLSDTSDDTISSSHSAPNKRTCGVDAATCPFCGSSPTTLLFPSFLLPSTSHSMAKAGKRGAASTSAKALQDQNARLAQELADLKAVLEEKDTQVKRMKKYKAHYLKTKVAVTGTMIPRPPGERGKKGWKLIAHMRLQDNKPLYNEIMRGVRSCADQAGLDPTVRFNQQDPGRLYQCYKEARQRFPYLQNFDGDWPTKEFIRQAFSDRRKYKVKLQVLTAPGEDDGGEDAADDELGPESDGDSGEE